ncbi:ribonuclease H, putative [Eimeria acervulina]|uniref:ribonuclease H n=1 Tax=Eimeria acervulina TaxID=5801 RepID=U6GGX1_EIMAC|nr:ribonuclease H, putative [Eimeria acervulina]CDI77844.1 ribonuclease H, putative [Eimeria acervulina]
MSVQLEVNEDSSRPSAEDIEEVAVYADGACLGNGHSFARAGIGVYFGSEDPKNISLPLLLGPHTNQRAELASLLVALLQFEAADDAAAAAAAASAAAAAAAVRSSTEKKQKEVKLVVYSDSEYAIKCVGLWSKRWRLNGWASAAGKPAKNTDLVHAVLLLCERRRQGAPPGARWRGAVSFIHVKGHSGVDGNEAADRLAVAAAAGSAAASPASVAAAAAAAAVGHTAEDAENADLWGALKTRRPHSTSYSAAAGPKP